MGDKTDTEGSLRIQITEVGNLEPELQLPDGGIDADLCGDCWRWIRSIAAVPEELGAPEPASVLVDDVLETDD